MSGITPVNQTSVETASAAVAAAGTERPAVDFASVLADSVSRDAAILSSQLPSGAGYTDMYGAGIEQMMLSAAASGELTKSQIAMFMLYTMTDGGSGEFGRYMPIMLEALAGADAAPSSSAGTASYGGVLSAGLPGVSGGTGAVLPVSEWIPTTPAIVNGEADRSPEALRAVIDQFGVETSERYRPRRNGSDTYCNIFVWDVTSALGSEIPHYADPETGAPLAYPDVSGALEQGAIAMETWLETFGAQYGWREVDAETAQRYANEGRPAVTTSKDAGHTQIVCPSSSGGYDPARGVSIAQAGSRVYNYAYTTDVYSREGLKNVRYFVHE
ncbi:MAG: hypothetical protein LBS51_03270 [Oscillospiraceae bacterium]|jgi:hypothetical protein|nr:hypothetical protein [Oscillospiraceae bacterium]